MNESVFSGWEELDGRPTSIMVEASHRIRGKVFAHNFKSRLWTECNFVSRNASFSKKTFRSTSYA